MSHLKLGTLPIIVLIVSILTFTILSFNIFIPNVPYLKLVLNIIFLTAINIYIATISGKSYLNSGAFNLLIISNVFLIVGINFLISGLASFVSENNATVIQDIGLLIASGLQFLAAVVTISTTSSSEPFSRKITLAVTYIVSIISIGLFAAEMFTGDVSVFFSSMNIALIYRAPSVFTAFFFASAGFLFLWQYFHTKERALYWYSLALFLFSLCSIGFGFQTHFGEDLYSWIGTVALYVGSLYFLTALLQLRKEKESFTDISEKWAESLISNRRQISALFANMVNGFAYNKIILDKNGKPADIIIIEANKAYERIIGMPRSEFIGKRASTMFPYPSPDEKEAASRIAMFEAFSKVALAETTIDTEFHFTELNKWIHITAYSPKKYYFVSTFQDITKRKELEKKIRDYTKNLEQLVEERTKQLQESERLAAIGQTAGMIGHDIRNPLQAITNELYIAKQMVKKEDEIGESKEMLESVNLIQDQIDYISKIVADLQDYSRQLKPEFSVVDLSEVISGVLQIALRKGNVDVSVNVAGDFRVKTDSVFVKRILGNLVINSVQAMPDGGKLDISAIRKENQVILTVSDTGKGVPEEAKPKMFKPLFTTKAKGQGLGLSVVKRLVEALNGSITFESQEGKGTTFIIVLPDLENQKS